MLDAQTEPKGSRNKPVMTAEAEVHSALRYDAPEDEYLFDGWLQAQVGLLFEAENAKAVLSVEYLESLGAGDSYLRGGTEYSNFQIGYYVQDWGAAYSTGLWSVFNARDDRWPDNIFFSKYYKPNPLFTMTAGRENFFFQAAISNKEESIESIQDSDAGIRAVLGSGEAKGSLGVIKRIGDPTVLSFGTLEQRSNNGRQWLEVDWKYAPSEEDEWSMALGFSRDLSGFRVSAEYLLLDTEDVVFLEEDFLVSDTARFNLQLYCHLPDFSTALSGFFIIGLGDGFSFEPGVYGFMGEKGSYFAATTAENDNRVVIRMRFRY